MQGERGEENEGMSFGSGRVCVVVGWGGVGSLQRATLKAEVGKREAKRRQAAP